MVVQKMFRIAFALFVKAHCIASHSFRIALFAAFLHFFHLFCQYFTVNAPKSCEKGKKYAQNMQKKSAKCEKVRNANTCFKLANHFSQPR
jgi:hypothetical protein